MKVLWFEVTLPSRFSNNNAPIAGWQDALEDLIRKENDIELSIAFPVDNVSNIKSIDGVTYYPITPIYSRMERMKNRLNCELEREKIISLSLAIIHKCKPDIIHVFGSEWCYGQVAKYVNIPVIIHMQGSLPPYFNAKYPPGYSKWDEMLSLGLNLRQQLLFYLREKKNSTRVMQEVETLQIVKYYMGRTCWDKTIVSLYNPKAKYFYCSEALRKPFIDCSVKWRSKNRDKIHLITVGCSSFWKGMDTVLRTAKLLKERNVDFEWRIAGRMAVKNIIEYKEKIKFSDYNVKILDFVNVDELINELLNADIYVHTAYIDNSPNSICEAQYLGLPIIATYVGGIPSLVCDKEDGVLIPANDPFTLAKEIMLLKKDYKRQLYYSNNNIEKAYNRHDSYRILEDLVTCYKSLIMSNNA